MYFSSINEATESSKHPQQPTESNNNNQHKKILSLGFIYYYQLGSSALPTLRFQ
jgi:hypothetical protein